ncbi:MAG: ImmA/IrrE family metallo-endopeptidase [Lachnospiraceae bacterium]
MKKLTDDKKIKLYEEVCPVALKYRESFIQKDEVIKDTFKTIEQLGFLLLRFPAVGENTSLSGFTMYKQPYHCIYVNSRQNLGRQYLSCWHECYHIYTGEGSGISYTESAMEDPFEYKANVFASIILMPDNLVKGYIESHRLSVDYLKYEDIIQMQNFFNVGYSAMLTRIIQLYPQYKKNLQNRYAIAGKSEKQRKLLEEKTQSVNGNLQLINATNDIYISDSFYEDIRYNLDKKRISKEKAFELLKVIDGLTDGL